MKILSKHGWAVLGIVFLAFWGCKKNKEDQIQLRLSASASVTDPRAEALVEKFGPAIEEFAVFQPHWNSSLFKQNAELEQIARGNLEMSIASAQELSVFIPEFSIFSAGYVHRDADHQVVVFNDPLMEPFKRQAEEKLDIKLLTVMYTGRRQLNLRTDQKVMKPEDLAGVKLRMPGTESWQFLGRALGANPTPMAFSEVYTGLQTGAIDGQDNPLPLMVDRKFYEVTKQVILTSHLVDLNYLALSKKVWDGLTAEQQQKIQQAADSTAAYLKENQLAKEAELVEFLRERGLEVYEPDVDAFRTRVQQMTLESDLAASWPPGVLDRINGL